MFKTKNKFQSNISSPARAAIRNKILTRSLMWFGGAVTFVLLFSFAVLKIEALRDNLAIFSLKFFTSLGTIGSIFVLLIAVALHLVAYFTILKRSSKVNFIALIAMFAFVVFMDMWIVVFSFLYVDQARGFEGVLIMIAIPMIATVVLGILGYFKIINFNKLIPLMIVLFVSLFVAIIVGIFMMNDLLNTFISGIGILLYLIYMGWIFYTIRGEEEYLAGIPVDYWSRAEHLDDDEKKVVSRVINRASLAYGMLLFVSFVRLIYYLANLMGRR